MRKLPPSILVICFFLRGYGQTDSLAVMLKEGVRLNDQGDYTGAIARYDAILAKNDRYFSAYVEKTITLAQSGRYQDCVDLSQRLIKEFPNGKGFEHVYDTYGSAMDALGKPDEAIRIYEEGIQKFPDFYLLPFNKGMTEFSQKKNGAAIIDYETAIRLHPGHASSHLYLAYAVYPANRMAAAMAMATFMLLEMEGPRAQKNLPLLLKMLGGNVEKKDDQQINITMSSDAADTSKKEDDFRVTELMMGLMTASAMGAKAKDTSAIKQLTVKLEVLGIANPEKKGFFTHTYVPFFAGLKKADLLEVAAHLIYWSSGDEDNQRWLKRHAGKMDDLEKYLHDWMEPAH
jgi:hypothetical protein